MSAPRTPRPRRPGHIALATAVAVTALATTLAGCGPDDTSAPVSLPSPADSQQAISRANLAHLWPLTVEAGLLLFSFVFPGFPRPGERRAPSFVPPLLLSRRAAFALARVCVVGAPRCRGARLRAFSWLLWAMGGSAIPHQAGEQDGRPDQIVATGSQENPTSDVFDGDRRLADPRCEDLQTQLIQVAIGRRSGRLGQPGVVVGHERRAPSDVPGRSRRHRPDAPPNLTAGRHIAGRATQQ